MKRCTDLNTKYDHLSKEELVSLLLSRDSSRKIGLVWERDELEHEKSLNNDFVTLDFEQNYSLGEAPYDNLLIEGDNFDALRYLNIAYKGRVKCIYIDPPYNTGNKDFIYNDRFVDKEDAWRHSKWLEYLYRRLELAKDLLSVDGVIFVSIGEEEYSHLSLLMEQVFPGKKVCTFVWRRRSGANDEKNWFVSEDHEYILCYANPGFTFAGINKDWSKATDDGDDRGPWVDGPLNQGKDIKQRPESYYQIFNPVTDTWYPCDPDSVWRFATIERAKVGKKIRTKYMEELVEEDRISWPANEQTVTYNSLEELYEALENGSAPHNLRVYERYEGLKEEIANGTADARILENIPPFEFWIGKKIGMGKPRLKRFVSEIKKTDKPLSTWVLPSSIKKVDLEEIDLEEVVAFTVGYTSEGTSLLSKMVGNKDFQYPKPLSLIKSLVRQSTDSSSNDIILDFFAGSGTTGHAVMEVNAEDDGDRRYILVSSTEATIADPDKNVCRDITAKRLRAAIEGYSWRTAKGIQKVEGLGGSFAYFKTQRIPHNNLYLDINHDQIWYALQQMHADSITPFLHKSPIQIFEKESLLIIYIPQLDSESYLAAMTKFEKRKVPTIVYTWQPGLLKQKIHSEHIFIQNLPDVLIERFGGSQ